MRIFIKFAVAFFMSFLLFLICSYVLGVASEQISTIGNETLAGTGHDVWISDFLFGMGQKTFGVVSVLTLIGTIIAYLLESHRFEGEQFEYYRRF